MKLEKYTFECVHKRTSGRARNVPTKDNKTVYRQTEKGVKYELLRTLKIGFELMVNTIAIMPISRDIFEQIGI